MSEMETTERKCVGRVGREKVERSLGVAETVGYRSRKGFGRRQPGRTSEKG